MGRKKKYDTRATVLKSQKKLYKRYMASFRKIGYVKHDLPRKKQPGVEYRTEDNDLEIIEYIDKCIADGETTTDVFRRAFAALFEKGVK